MIAICIICDNINKQNPFYDEYVEFVEPAGHKFSTFAITSISDTLTMCSLFQIFVASNFLPIITFPPINASVKLATRFHPLFFNQQNQQILHNPIKISMFQKTIAFKCILNNFSRKIKIKI